MLGLRGEDAVARWYEGAGYLVLARNWRCQDGEIDLVALSPTGVVAICEVKTRSTSTFGSPFEAVTISKQRRLRRLAARWLASRPPGDRTMVTIRFDVAGVMAGPAGDLVVDLVEEAF